MIAITIILMIITMIFITVIITMILTITIILTMILIIILIIPGPKGADEVLRRQAGLVHEEGPERDYDRIVHYLILFTLQYNVIYYIYSKRDKMEGVRV